ncbi:hypothetical protein [Streptomyces flavidovirens]
MERSGSANKQMDDMGTFVGHHHLLAGKDVHIPAVLSDLDFLLHMAIIRAGQSIEDDGSIHRPTQA